ncbi:MAG: thioredoxin domain-containing protein [Patescibacteria group bacterium]
MFGRQKESQGGLLDAPPKTTFILGLFVGIAATAIVSLIVVVPLLNSNDSSGAVKGTNTNTTNQAADADTGGSVVDIATPDSDTDHYRGAKPEEAAIVLVEYSDFQCPYCQKFQPIAKQLVDDYDGQLSWVYRHFPLSGHANAKPAAEAAECAGKLGGNDVFWQYADKLYVNQNSLSKDYYKELAGELGLNAAKFASCLDSGEFTSKIEAQFNEGASAGVNGTPASIVLPGNDTSKGQLVSGALPVDQFKKIIDAAL